MIKSVPSMHSLKLKTGLAAAVVATALTAGAAQAQLDPRSPLDITADSSEVINSQCVSSWTGAVEALQGRTRLRADEVRIYTVKRGDSCGANDRLEATGDVYFVTPERKVRAARAVYQFSSETITLTGGVVVVQGKSVVSGDSMVINTRTGQASMTSAVRGRNKAGRVRGVFYPNEGTTR